MPVSQFWNVIKFFLWQTDAMQLLLYSYIHANVSMRFLTCEPQSVTESLHYSPSPSPTTWTDEADQFFDSPESWLRDQYGGPSGRPWPSHLVFFSNLHRDISGLLVQAGYKICGSFFHTHFAEGRVSGSVLVTCRWEIVFYLYLKICLLFNHCSSKFLVVQSMGFWGDQHLQFFFSEPTLLSPIDLKYIFLLCCNDWNV